jgi:hypothetical protein
MEAPRAAQRALHGMISRVGRAWRVMRSLCCLATASRSARSVATRSRSVACAFATSAAQRSLARSDTAAFSAASRRSASSCGERWRGARSAVSAWRRKRASVCRYAVPLAPLRRSFRTRLEGEDRRLRRRQLSAGLAELSFSRGRGGGSRSADRLGCRARCGRLAAARLRQRLLHLDGDSLGLMHARVRTCERTQATTEAAQEHGRARLDTWLRGRTSSSAVGPAGSPFLAPLAGGGAMANKRERRAAALEVRPACDDHC